jgi:Rod binding domain-containing protein
MSTTLSPVTSTSAVAASPVASISALAVDPAIAPVVAAKAANAASVATPVSAGTAAAVAAKPVLTAEQKAALKNLHATAQQFESLFVNMLFKSMRAASPQTSITGDKLSPAETTFTEMLDEKRSEALAKTGAFGIGKILEDQLKASVLANPASAAKARLAPEGIL